MRECLCVCVSVCVCVHASIFACVSGPNQTTWMDMAMDMDMDMDMDVDVAACLEGHGRIDVSDGGVDSAHQRSVNSAKTPDNIEPLISQH